MKFPIGGMYSDGVLSDVVNTTTCDLPSKRWKADQDGYLFGNTPQVKGERNMVLVNGDEHCTSPTAKEGEIFTTRKMELIDPISNTESSNQAHESLNELSGRTHLKEKINSYALLAFLVPEMYQSSKIYIENQTMSITCKFRIPTRHLVYMLGILCRSWMQFSNISMRRYHQHNIEARVLSHSFTIIQGYLTRCGIAELQINAFAKVSRMRKCESTYANLVLCIPKIYENWMLFMILKSRYHQLRPKQGFNQCHMMPIKCTTVPSTLILLHLTDKLHIDTKNNCFVTSCDNSSIDLKGKTVEKDSTKASNGFKTCTEIRFCEIKMKNHAIVIVWANCKRYFQVQFDPSINECAGNISNTWKNYLMRQEKLYKHRFKKKSRQVITNVSACQQTSCIQAYRRSPEMEYKIFQKRSNTIIISIPRNASPPYHFLADSKANSRTSLFEEGAPDVGQNVAQEPTLYYSGPIYIGDPLNAYWAKGTSLGLDTFVRKSPWDQKYL